MMKTSQMNIKMDEKDLVLLHKIAIARGEGVGDFVRLAIRKELARLGFLKPTEVQALGV